MCQGIWCRFTVEPRLSCSCSRQDTPYWLSVLCLTTFSRGSSLVNWWVDFVISYYCYGKLVTVTNPNKRWKTAQAPVQTLQLISFNRILSHRDAAVCHARPDTKKNVYDTNLASFNTYRMFKSIKVKFYTLICYPVRNSSMISQLRGIKY